MSNHLLQNDGHAAKSGFAHPKVLNYFNTCRMRSPVICPTGQILFPVAMTNDVV
jgi:hypothetical protein